MNQKSDLKPLADQLISLGDQYKSGLDFEEGIEIAGQILEHAIEIGAFSSVDFVVLRKRCDIKRFDGEPRPHAHLFHAAITWFHDNRTVVHGAFPSRWESTALSPEWKNSSYFLTNIQAVSSMLELEATPDPETKPPPLKGEWSAPMSKSEAARRLTGRNDARWREVSGMFNSNEVHVITPHKSKFLLGRLDPSTRRKLEQKPERK